MIHLATSDLLRFLASYGDFAFLLFVAIESIGIPFPGETMLLVAAIFAGTTHRLSIPLVIVAAESFAILGDNLGFWVGREGGFRLQRRYGRYIRLDERKLKLGLYLFRRHGGKVVFFGRFIAVLRAWTAFLAGTNRMRWPAFLLFNALAMPQPPVDGGLWSGPKVALWMQAKIGRPVNGRRGWDYLQRLGYSARVPRPQHAKADEAEQEVFKKTAR